MTEHINPEKIQELQELMGDSFGMLIDTFINDTAANINRLKQDADADNSTEINRIAHSLKSSCANLGLDTMSETARQLEQTAKIPDMDAVPQLINQLEQHYKLACQALQQYS